MSNLEEISFLTYMKRILERMGACKDWFIISDGKMKSYVHYSASIDSMFPKSDEAELKFAYEFFGFKVVKKIDCSVRKEDRFDTVIYHYELDLK